MGLFQITAHPVQPSASRWGSYLHTPPGSCMPARHRGCLKAVENPLVSKISPESPQSSLFMTHSFRKSMASPVTLGGKGVGGGNIARKE